MTSINNIQRKKASEFKKLHYDDEILVLFNCWDIGSAKLIANNNAKAIATTSVGVSASLGYTDGQNIPIEIMLHTIANIVNATMLPVNADIEAGYGNNVEEIINSVTKFIDTGIAGINIEDGFVENNTIKLLDKDEMSNRITAIRKLTDQHNFDLVINARTDPFMAKIGKESDWLATAIERGNLFKEAGATCVFVPHVTELNVIKILVNEINAPINVLINPTRGAGLPPSISVLQDIGVSRVSFGSSPYKAVMTLAYAMLTELSSQGTNKILGQQLIDLEKVKHTMNAITNK